MSWMAFVEGFAREAGNIIGERKDKAEEFEQRTRDLAERNKGKIALMQQAVRENEALVNRARGLLASDAQISMALDSGPNGLRDMVDALSAAKLDPKFGHLYDQSYVDQAYVVREDYTPNVNVAARFGLGSYQVGDVDMPESDFLGAALGRDAMQRARANLDAELFGGTGMSVYDAAQISDGELYRSLDPSSFLRNTAPDVLTSDRWEQLERAYTVNFNETVRSLNAIRDSQLARLEVEAVASEIELGSPAHDALKQPIFEEYNTNLQNWMRGHFGYYGEGVLGYRDEMRNYLQALGGDHLLGVAILDGPNNEETPQATGATGGATTGVVGAGETSAAAADANATAQGAVPATGDMFTPIQMPAPTARTRSVPLYMEVNGEQYELLLLENGAIYDPDEGTGFAPSQFAALTQRAGRVFKFADGTVYEGGGIPISIAEESAQVAQTRAQLQVDLATSNLSPEQTIAAQAQLEALEQREADLSRQLPGMADLGDVGQGEVDEAMLTRVTQQFQNAKQLALDPDVSRQEMLDFLATRGITGVLDGNEAVRQYVLDELEDLQDQVVFLSLGRVPPRPRAGATTESQVAAAQWTETYGAFWNPNGTPSQNHPGLAAAYDQFDF